jgi:hypothetical protein
MIQVDQSHFSNVIGAVQRTASLTGGSVRGLPNGAVIDGLSGVSSFGSAVAEAQKEFQLGRTHASLDRIRQLESQFNGIVGRWESNVRSLIGAAKQGRQQLPLQKLNEVKNAQARMQQLTGPASKAFRDLVSALEHAVAMEGLAAADAREGTADAQPLTSQELDSKLVPVPADSAADQAPTSEQALASLPGQYRYGERLQVQRGPDNKPRIVPKLEKDKLYFVAGWNPPRVVRVTQLQPKAVLVYDTVRLREAMIEARELAALIRQGVWTLG